MVANFSPVHRSSKELRSSKTLSEDVTTNDEENDSDITAEVSVEPEAGKYYAIYGDTPQGYFIVKCLKVINNTFSGKYMTQIATYGQDTVSFKESREKDRFVFGTVITEISSLTVDSSILSVPKAELNDVVDTVAEID